MKECNMNQILFRIKFITPLLIQGASLDQGYKREKNPSLKGKVKREKF